MRAAGASRAGILFGMAPLFSALIAILAFGESLRWPLVVGTFLVVAGGVAVLAQITLFEALDRSRVTVVAPLAGTGVL